MKFVCGVLQLNISSFFLIYIYTDGSCTFPVFVNVSGPSALLFSSPLPTSALYLYLCRHPLDPHCEQEMTYFLGHSVTVQMLLWGWGGGRWWVTFPTALAGTGSLLGGLSPLWFWPQTLAPSTGLTDSLSLTVTVPSGCFVSTTMRDKSNVTGKIAGVKYGWCVSSAPNMATDTGSIRSPPRELQICCLGVSGGVGYKGSATVFANESWALNWIPWLTRSPVDTFPSWRPPPQTPNPL